MNRRDLDVANLVYVVRCKDCRHRFPSEDMKYKCLLTITEQGCKQVIMNDEDYCSRGERK